MQIDEKELERKLVYRLIKACYSLSLIILCLVGLIIVYFARPTQYIDTAKSTINCIAIQSPKSGQKGVAWDNPQQVQAFKDYAISQGADPVEADQFIATSSAAFNNSKKAYSLDNAHLYISSKSDSLSKEDDAATRKLCAYAVINDLSNKYPVPQIKNYDLNLIESTQGDWATLIGGFLIGLVMGYSILSIIKETLFYIIFGKSFSWSWLTRFKMKVIYKD